MNYAAPSTAAPLPIVFDKAIRTSSCGEPSTSILIRSDPEQPAQAPAILGEIVGEFHDHGNYSETLYRLAEYAVVFRSIPGVANRCSDPFVVGDGEGEYANARLALSAAKAHAREVAGLPQVIEADVVRSKIEAAKKILASLSTDVGALPNATVAAFVSQAAGSLAMAEAGIDYVPEFVTLRDPKASA